MTGFGEGKATLADLSLSVQISTVNKKQLDIHISLPKYISYLEAEAHKQKRKALTRGRVNPPITIKEHPVICRQPKGSSVRMLELTAPTIISDKKRIEHIPAPI